MGCVSNQKGEKNMPSIKQIHWFACLAMICGLAPPLNADCSASQNCGFCNSGSFTASCQCHDGSGFVCTKCDPPNPCTATGCCCGVVTQTGKTYCSSFSCGGTGTCLTQMFPHMTGLVASTSPTVPASSAVGQADEVAGPKILNLEPAIEIVNSSGSEVTISDFKLALDSEKISGATYTIRNNSEKPLIAFSTGMDFYWDISPDQPLHASSTEDGWFLNGLVLKPGEEEQAHFMSGLTPSKPMHLLRIVVSIDYAQFSDGSMVGRNAATVGAKFNESRRIKLDVQHHYADLLKSGTAAGAVAEQIQSDLQNGKHSQGERTALIQMRVALDNLGTKGLAAKLLEEPAVKIQ